MGLGKGENTKNIEQGNIEHRTREHRKYKLSNDFSQTFLFWLLNSLIFFDEQLLQGSFTNSVLVKLLSNLF